MNSVYPYSRGDLIENPNTYFYTKFEGAPFLKAWKENREAVGLAGATQELPLTAWVKAGGEARPIEIPGEGLALMRQLFLGLRSGKPDHGLLKLFVKRFEVKKRIFSAYKKNLIAAEGANFTDLDLYICAAELFSEAYGQTKDLTYLNCLLKIDDILVGAANQLAERHRAQCRAILGMELTFVGALAAKAGVAL